MSDMADFEHTTPAARIWHERRDKNARYVMRQRWDVIAPGGSCDPTPGLIGTIREVQYKAETKFVATTINGGMPPHSEVWDGEDETAPGYWTPEDAADALYAYALAMDWTRPTDAGPSDGRHPVTTVRR